MHSTEANNERSFAFYYVVSSNEVLLKRVWSILLLKYFNIYPYPTKFTSVSSSGTLRIETVKLFCNFVNFYFIFNKTMGYIKYNILLSNLWRDYYFR